MTANIQVSYRDQHGRIFVIGGSTPEEFELAVQGMLGNEKVGQVFDDFQLIADPPVAEAVANAASLRTGNGPAAAAASVPGAPLCDHGMPRVYKEAFTSRAGRAMPSSWQCNNPDRNNQCKAKWNDA